MINILIADDHQVLIDGLKSILENSKDIKVVAEAHNGLETLEKLKLHKVDVVLLDIDMPEMDGFDCCKAISKDYPNVKPIILTMYENTKYIQSLFQLGAKGYLFKNTATAELVKAIKNVHNGETYLTDKVQKMMMDDLTNQKKKSSSTSNLPKLTRREKEILKLIANESTTQEIADKLFISYNTVESHRKNILLKLGVKNSAGLVRVAIEKRLLDD